MAFAFIVDLHNIHVLGFAFAGARATKDAFGRDLDRADPLHFLHTVSLMAIAPRVLFAANEWLGPQLSPRSNLAMQIAGDQGLNSLRPVGSTQLEREQIALAAADYLEGDLDLYCHRESIGHVSDRVVLGQGPIEWNVTLAARRLLSETVSRDEQLMLLEQYRHAPNNTLLLMLTLRPSLYNAIHARFWPSLGDVREPGVFVDRLETLFRLYIYLACSRLPGTGRAWYSPAFDRVAHWGARAAAWSPRTRASALPDHEDLAVLVDDISSLLLSRSGGDPRELLRLTSTFRLHHGAAIDTYLAAGLESYEGRQDTSASQNAERLHDEIRHEFSGSRAILERLDGFLAAHGVAMMAGAPSIHAERRVVVKGAVHGERGRRQLQELPEYQRLCRLMEEGTGSKVILPGGRSPREAAKDRIKSDPDCLRLIDAVTQGAVFLMGSGVTMFTGGDDQTHSWPGLVRHGLHAVERKSGRQELARIVLELVDRVPTSSSYRYAGDVIRENLSDAEWGEWLRDVFGGLSARTYDLIEAIAALANDCPVRLATTNYDRVFELNTNSKFTACVPDPACEAMVEHFLNDRRSRYVFHIHGVFDNPDSVILGNVSYGVLAGNPVFSYIRRLFENRLVFVGFAGFDDPTFTRLVRYHQEFRYKPSHFLLLTASAREQMAPRLGADVLTPIVYGDDYSDLPVFLHAVREVALDRT